LGGCRVRGVVGGGLGKDRAPPPRPALRQSPPIAGCVARATGDDVRHRHRSRQAEGEDAQGIEDRQIQRIVRIFNVSEGSLAAAGWAAGSILL